MSNTSVYILGAGCSVKFGYPLAATQKARTALPSPA